jgi:nicotinamide-nucleotide amidase
MVPDGAEVLPNDHGTAPGLYLQETRGTGPSRHIFLLPGPPRELIPMFESLVLPRLKTMGGPPIAIRILRTIGIPESHLQERIEAPLRSRFPEVEIGYCARPGEVDLRLISANADAVERAAAFASADLGDAVYTTGDENLEVAVVRLATASGLRLATAESCTGGHIADRITSVPGASAIFVGAAIVYSNEEKTRQLGVPAELIARHGAVSEDVAAAMAAGCFERTGADHVIALTGVAGPGPGTPEKPAGLCFIAHRSMGHASVKRHMFPPDRPAFKEAATQAALDILRRRLILLPGITEKSC